MVQSSGLAAATAALTLGLPLVLVHFGLDYVITRNVIFVAVPVTVLVAVGLAAGRFGWLGAAGAVALCAVGATVALRVQSSAALQRPAWRAVAGALGPGNRSRAIGPVMRSAFLRSSSCANRQDPPRSWIRFDDAAWRPRQGVSRRCRD